MKHINDNRLCAISFKTSGSIPGHHDLLEIAIVPMVGMSKDKTIFPFNMRIKPEHPENFPIGRERGFSRADLTEHMNGLPSWEVVTLFEKWYKQLGLAPNKRIIPIGYDLPKLWTFLMRFHSWSAEGENFVEDFYDFSQSRHMETITHYWNDLAWRNDQNYPFHKHSKTYAAYRLGFVYPEKRTVLSDAFMIAETWARSVNLILPTGMVLPINYPKPVNYDIYNEPDEHDLLHAEDDE